MFVSMLLFSQLSATCAAGDIASQGEQWVHTLEAVARVESKNNSLAIHNNSTKESYSPTTRDEAVKLATSLIERGNKIDLGLMQISSANLSGLALSISNAFDPCHSIAAGSHILRDGYQRALRMAFSFYNTGSASRGIQNGYSDRVEAASRAIGTTPGEYRSASAEIRQPVLPPPCAPAWDPWAEAACSGQPPVQPDAATAGGVISVSINKPE